MPSKRKERPCDSVPTDRRCRVCCNPRDKKPCQGPLPETSEAEPSRSCSSPISESTSAVTTGSGRIVIGPIRLAEDDDYVEQLGRLRDQRDQPWKQPDHVTKDPCQGRPDRGADGRSERAARAIDQGARCIAVRTVMAPHTREMKGMEATSKRSMASSSLLRRAWRSCATRRLVVPNRCCTRRS